MPASDTLAGEGRKESLEELFLRLLNQKPPQGPTGLLIRHGDPVFTIDTSDDVARLDVPRNRPLIVTTDTLVHGVHFLSVFHAPTKLIRVNLSDIHAKGAIPHSATLSVAWPRGTEPEQVESFAKELKRELVWQDIPLLGGDTVATTGPLTLTMTMIGTCLRPSGPVRRDTAQIGDDIWITGSIGRAELGLRIERYQEMMEPPQSYPFLDAYHKGEIPGETGAGCVAAHATASMDVSDGLLIDLDRLARASGLAAKLELSDIPLCDEVRSAHFLKICSERQKPRRIMKIASFGDDYQILFTAPPERRAAIEAHFAFDGSPGVSRIGSMARGLGLKAFWNGRPRKLPDRLGYLHD